MECERLKMNNLKTENNTVYFPKRLNHQTVAEMCQHIEQICQSTMKNRAIYFDAQHFEFIDAFAMTVLFNEIAYIKSLNWKTYIRNHYNTHGQLKEPIQYMDDCEFFLLMSGKKLNPQSHCRTTSLPIKRLAPQETLAWLHYTAIPWLARKLNVQTNNLIEIRICVEELLNNIRDHSDVAFSSIFIQHYPNPKLPKNNNFKICISDNGIGLINRIQGSHPHFSTQQAIDFAFEEGCTTKSSPRNAGMGLFTLSQTVCHNGGTLTLRTGKINALITSNEQKQRNLNYLDNAAFLKGTAFEITLYADKLDIQQINTETFSWD